MVLIETMLSIGDPVDVVWSIDRSMKTRVGQMLNQTLDQCICSLLGRQEADQPSWPCTRQCTDEMTMTECCLAMISLTKVQKFTSLRSTW